MFAKLFSIMANISSNWRLERHLEAFVMTRKRFHRTKCRYFRIASRPKSASDESPAVEGSGSQKFTRVCLQDPELKEQCPGTALGRAA